MEAVKVVKNPEENHMNTLGVRGWPKEGNPPLPRSKLYPG